MKGSVVLLIWICLLSFPATVVGWEFTLRGENILRYRYWARMGNDDIFGRVDTNVNLGVNHLKTHPSPARDNTPGPSFGVLAGENRFGADMNFADLQVTLYPRIKVNPAISFECSINLTSLGLHEGGRPLGNWGIPGEVNQLAVPISNRPAAINVPNTMATMQWWKMVVDLPIFSLSMGYRPSGLGIGIWKSPCQRSSTSIAARTGYGPLTVGFGTYWGRSTTGWNQYPRDSGTRSTYRRDDDRDYLGGVYGDVRYMSGPLIIELSSNSFSDLSSQQVDARDFSTGAPGDLTTVTTPIPDRLVYELTVAFKYYAGNFFFNGELDRYSHYRSGIGTTVIRAGRRVQKTDTDTTAWLYGLETGVVLRPAVLTLSYARSTGNDPATRKDDEATAPATTGLNNCVMRNWAFLMYHLYGAGTGWNASGDGQPVNLHHLGVRLDYAVAANLNVGVVYSRAWRDQANASILGGDYSHTVAAFTNDTIAQQKGLAGFGPPVPGLRAVPDYANEVGWEVDLHTDWKLLENFTLRNVVALWKPGNWWSYAYPNTVAIYRRNHGTVPQDPTDSVGAVMGAGRDIDPLFAIQTELRTEF